MIGLPLFLEKLFVFFSFKACRSVITSKSFGSFVQWLSSYSQSKNKLKFISIFPEALPTNKFIRDSLDIDIQKRYEKNEECFWLLYVGGLREEKLIEDVLKMLSYFIKSYKTTGLIKLKIVGDGPARMQLGNLARELGIEDNVFFLGSLSNENLVEEYSNADVFVSPLTGTSLREAALCGLPIVAYDIDWISGFFENGENILLAKNRNFKEMAKLVYLLYSDVDIRIKISKNIFHFARKNFIFEEDQKEIVLSEYENAYK
jgi:glycosyltransferase involved in cell wall biosynthesis